MVNEAQFHSTGKCSQSEQNEQASKPLEAQIWPNAF